MYSNKNVLSDNIANGAAKKNNKYRVYRVEKSTNMCTDKIETIKTNGEGAKHWTGQ